MKRLSLYIWLLLLNPINGNCWWSLWTLETSNHYKISQKAIDSLSAEDFPDIKRFSKTIVEGTSDPTDDANAHGKITDAEVGYTGREDAGKFNGGDFKSWMNFARIKYASGNYNNDGYSAYYYVALMTHLVQDQAVPAHAANIYHASAIWVVPTDTDDLESYSDGKEPGLFSALNLGNHPLRYYYDKENWGGALIRGLRVKRQNKSSHR